MTPLVWADLALALLFVLAITGIPLWLVIRHPDKAADHSQAHAYLRARAEHAEAGRAGAGSGAHVITMAVAPASPRRGRWHLAPPRTGQPAGPAAGC